MVQFLIGCAYLCLGVCWRVWIRGRGWISRRRRWRIRWRGWWWIGGRRWRIGGRWICRRRRWRLSGFRDIRPICCSWPDNVRWSGQQLRRLHCCSLSWQSRGAGGGRQICVFGCGGWLFRCGGKGSLRRIWCH